MLHKSFIEIQFKSYLAEMYMFWCGAGKKNHEKSIREMLQWSQIFVLNALLVVTSRQKKKMSSKHVKIT